MLRICRMITLFASCFMSMAVYSHSEDRPYSSPASAEPPVSWLDFFIAELNAAASFRIDERDGYRYIESDGLPDHATGRFPNSRNPNAISTQRYQFRVPLVVESATLATAALQTLSPK